MLCMESYGRIVPMAHMDFSCPGSHVYRIVRSVSAGGSAFSQEAAGVTPWGGSPTNSKKRIKSKEL